MARTILIGGPTASGKSGVAIALARRLGGVVINADSMQVYAELGVLTARPTADELAAAPHRLYGHVAGAEGYSVGRYLREAEAAIGAAHAEGKAAIVVGGTGLYLKALTEGLSSIPDIPGSIRANWRAKARQLGAKGLRAEIEARDPVMAARLVPEDLQRMTRALEVLDATGRSLAEWQLAPGRPVVPAGSATLVKLDWPRAALVERAAVRFHKMMRLGALDEVRALVALGLSPELPIMRALGVRPLAAHLEGSLGLAEAVEAGITETRHYIKRQQTWLKSNMIAYKSIDAQQVASNVAISDAIVAFTGH